MRHRRVGYQLSGYNCVCFPFRSGCRAPLPGTSESCQLRTLGRNLGLVESVDFASVGWLKMLCRAMTASSRIVANQLSSCS